MQYPGPSQSPLGSSTSANLHPKFDTMTYTLNLEQHLRDQHIFITNNQDGAKSQINLAEINARLDHRRPSIASSHCPQDFFAKFRSDSEEASNQRIVMTSLVPTIIGNGVIHSGLNILFRNLEQLTAESLPKAQPTFYDGAHQSEINQEIRQALNTSIVLSANSQAPCVPNFLKTVKGPGGSIREARI